jgi:hypothetical protein
MENYHQVSLVCPWEDLLGLSLLVLTVESHLLKTLAAIVCYLERKLFYFVNMWLM